MTRGLEVTKSASKCLALECNSKKELKVVYLWVRMLSFLAECDGTI